MPFVSITRLRVRSLRFLPSFILYAIGTTAEAQRAPGFLAAQLSASLFRRTYWTLTAWSDEAAMQAWRVSGVHRIVMPKLAHWCDEAAVAHWNAAAEEMPDEAETLRRMQTEGRTSRLRHMSAGHAAGVTVPDGRAPKFGHLLPPRRSK
jgi:heme-degrading monooxygenase HmoA